MNFIIFAIEAYVINLLLRVISVKNILTLLSVSLGVLACSSMVCSKPPELRFQEMKSGYSQLLNVTRDGILCAEDTEGNQNCSIEFYIDSIKAGNFYINNSAQYSLKPETYNFKVKNCTKSSCQSCDIDLSVGKLASTELVLSVNADGKPFISNNGQLLSCEVKHQATAEEHTIRVDLAADILFKFDGSSLNDLLPKGRQEVLNVASQIHNNFVSVSRINLVGHTDRLGSDRYNDQLGQNRADTVRNLLVQNSLAEIVVSTASAGKREPVTNGCFEVRQREALHACLQPDRRVAVEITGLSE